MSRATTLATAAAVDALFGEPPNALHPTVWMGRAIGAARRAHARRTLSPTQAVVAGGVALGLGALVTGALARRVDHALGSVARGAALKPAFSVRALLDAGAQVERALRRDDLREARRLLGWHLVSRDTGMLCRSEVAGAAIESLAENLSDSLVAPLLWYRAGGLTGAYVYRFVNTADAMLGYHTPELEWFGKAAARTDDAMNLLPARLTALLLALAAPSVGGSAREALRVARDDAWRTPSPNAGWPMAAMAGALGVQLDKRTRTEQAYVLHAAGALPDVHDLARARRLVTAAAALATGIAAIA